MDNDKKQIENEKEPDNVIKIDESPSSPHPVATEKNGKEIGEDASSKTTESPPSKDPYTLAINEVESLKKDLLYLRAEFENYKKQAIRERSDLIKYGGEGLVVTLLDILDNFDRALDVEINLDTMESFKQGVQLTASELKSTLKRFGIEEIDCLNKPFDPAIHEAMGSEESSKVTAGHITQVFKKPYKFHKKVIRAGQVIIAKKTDKAD